MNKIILNIMDFFNYVIRYWTHLTPLQISKKYPEFKRGVWHTCVFYFKVTDNDFNIDELTIRENK